MPREEFLVFKSTLSVLVRSYVPNSKLLPKEITPESLLLPLGPISWDSSESWYKRLAERTLPLAPAAVDLAVALPGADKAEPSVLLTALMVTPSTEMVAINLAVLKTVGTALLLVALPFAVMDSSLVLKSAMTETRTMEMVALPLAPLKLDTFVVFLEFLAQLFVVMA